MKHRMRMNLPRVSGVLIPDIQSGLILSGMIKSQADLLLKVARWNNGDEQPDAQKYRLIRDNEKRISGKEPFLSKKETKKQLSQLIRLFKHSLAWRPKFSDIKYMGHWWTLHAFAITARNDSIEAVWPISDYILHLCEIEKSLIKKHRASPSPSALLDDWYKHHIIPYDVYKNSLKTLPSEPFTGHKIDEWLTSNSDLKISAALGMYFLLGCIAEEYLYLENQDDLTGEQIQSRKIFTDILPSLSSSGAYTPSKKLLIDKVVKGLEFRSLRQFTLSLCGPGVEEDAVKQTFKRWRSDKAPILINTFNKLLRRTTDKRIPEEVIVAANMVDKLARDIQEAGFSKQETVDFMQRYTQFRQLFQQDYQSFTKRSSG